MVCAECRRCMGIWLLSGLGAAVDMGCGLLNMRSNVSLMSSELSGMVAGGSRVEIGLTSTIMVYSAEVIAAVENRFSIKDRALSWRVLLTVIVTCTRSLSRHWYAQAVTVRCSSQAVTVLELGWAGLREQELWWCSVGRAFCPYLVVSSVR